MKREYLILVIAMSLTKSIISEKILNANVIEAYLNATFAKIDFKRSFAAIEKTSKSIIPVEAQPKWSELLHKYFNYENYVEFVKTQKISTESELHFRSQTAKYSTPLGKAILASEQHYIQNAEELEAAFDLTQYPETRIKALTQAYVTNFGPETEARAARLLIPIMTKIRWHMQHGKTPYNKPEMEKLTEMQISNAINNIQKRPPGKEIPPNTLRRKLLVTKKLSDSEFSAYIQDAATAESKETTKILHLLEVDFLVESHTKILSEYQ